eukprot:1192528-Pyramimonas_sp.AAC.1
MDQHDALLLLLLLMVNMIVVVMLMMLAMVTAVTTTTTTTTMMMMMLMMMMMMLTGHKDVSASTGTLGQDAGTGNHKIRGCVGTLSPEVPHSIIGSECKIMNEKAGQELVLRQLKISDKDTHQSRARRKGRRKGGEDTNQGRDEHRTLEHMANT